jgi:hypothetical protein
MANWNDFTRAQFGADKFCPTDQGETLVDRDKYIGRLPFQMYMAEASTSSVTYATLVTFEAIYVPAFAVGGSLKFIPQVYVDAGTGDWRLYNVDTSTAGTAVTGITNTSYADSSEGEIAVADADGDSWVQYRIEGKIDDVANTFFMKNFTGVIGNITMWYEAP